MPRVLRRCQLTIILVVWSSQIMFDSFPFTLANIDFNCGSMFPSEAPADNGLNYPWFEFHSALGISTRQQFLKTFSLMCPLHIWHS